MRPDTRDGPPGRHTPEDRLHKPTSTPPGAEVMPAKSSVQPGADSGPDLDADLSVILDSAESIGVWVAIWQARAEPDAHARRCAADAIGAIDSGLAALHRVRAWLIGEVRQADDQAAARVDAMLAREAR
jgi:hypothetical protein